MNHYTTDLSLDPYEVENAFYLRSDPTRLAKLLAHYELYRKITHLPGLIVEAGVYKGASLMRFAAFREALETPHSRRIVGFDAFGAFPRDGVSGESDKAFIERFEDAGGHGISKSELEAALEAKGYGKVDLIAGDVFETVPQFLSDRPHTRIALLHLDMDVYEPTAFVIEKALPHMVPGGLIVFDDYGMVEGATRAGDELAKRIGASWRKLSHYEVPAFLEIA
ncbi:class I SAM-dependent methyltransferase [Erythrobacter sp. SCSIO 43205]|uniref:TylF/MycF/NovP-related O-methyltransferase n=1 Tax=Erythrobacter sp. SCSIO 43205 TaxID=2779361 RepID=UPI001CA8E512|nr:TylF/MycF/NovP-related O-methyltransferase [Erythrobacter sp. SCSIO 43205]UAB77506.1 class I SAM-dependent methyltransferase [Erythrobacter sp. SCSIO 43205]